MPRTSATQPDLARCVVLTGPTASGKSDIALLLAGQMAGEIISVDSMQVYRGMDIGTAKPSREDQARVPHHLLDVCELTDTFDAARFVTHATSAILDVQARGKTAILCGGTGFYLKALLHGLGRTPPSDPVLRRELESAALPDLLEELQEQDPSAYEVIDKVNRRRVVRAVEVIRLTGKPFSQFKPNWSGQKEQKPGPLHLVLSRSLEDLRVRINQRVDRMFDRGLVDEVQQVLKRGLATNRVASQALGYKQVIEHLAESRGLADTVNLVKQRTWQFAGRQLTWFRHQLPMRWVQVSAGTTPAAIAAQIVQSADRPP